MGLRFLAAQVSRIRPRNGRTRSAVIRGSRAGRREAVLVGSVLLLALLFGQVRDLDGWDDTFYLAQTSSLIEDGDVDLRNDALRAKLEHGELLRLLTTTRPNGSLLNSFSIGPSLLWMPAYGVGLPLRGGVGQAPAARWSTTQLAALCLLSLSLSYLVVRFLDRFLRWAGCDRRLALLAALALTMGSPLLVYGFRFYTTSHLSAAVASSWFVATVVLFDRRPRMLYAFLCGIALWLVFVCRWQGILVGLLLVVPLVHLPRRGLGWRRVAALAGLFLLGLGLVMSLQSHVWLSEGGEVFQMPQGGAT